MHSPGHPSLARPTASIIHIMRCCCTHIGRGLVFREFSFSLSTICFSSWRNNNERRAIEVPPSIEHMIAFLKLNTSNHRRVKSYAGTHMLLTAGAGWCARSPRILSPRAATASSVGAFPYHYNFFSFFFESKIFGPVGARKFTFCRRLICRKLLQPGKCTKQGEKKRLFSFAQSSVANLCAMRNRVGQTTRFGLIIEWRRVKINSHKLVNYFWVSARCFELEESQTVGQHHWGQLNT